MGSDAAFIHQLMHLRLGLQHLRSETIIPGNVGSLRVLQDRTTPHRGPGHLGLGVWSGMPALTGPHRISNAGKPEKRFTSQLITRKGL